MTTRREPESPPSPAAADAAEAVALARAALQADRDNPEARLALGSALRRAGDPQAAVEVLQPLAAGGDAWTVQAELGQALLACGLSRQAAGPIERALALNPQWGRGWRLLGDLRRLAREPDAARAADTGLLCCLVRGQDLREPVAALAAGRLDAAELALKALLRRDPHSTPTAHLLAEVFWRQGRLLEAEALLGACLRQAPGLDVLREPYAQLLHELGRTEAALAIVDEDLARHPADPRRRLLKVELLEDLRDYEAACEVMAGLLAETPDQPAAWTAHGHQFEILGRFDEAAAAFRRALALDPAHAQAWWGLAGLKRFRFTAEDEAAMRALDQCADLSDEVRGHLHFALGKADEDARRYAESFASYARGNALLARNRPWDPDATRVMIDRLKAVFTPEFLAARAGWGCRGADPIFVVGMPRSGSTLVEQILSSHPQVEGVGELAELGLTAMFVGGGDLRRYPDALPGADAAAIAALGQSYLDKTRRYRRQGRPRFVDKAPLNFFHIGLIRMILPDARIVEVRRHPLGACLSMFKENFVGGWGFTYELEGLGRYYRNYLELLDHWEAVLPGRVHRVVYEDLVEDTPSQVRDLLAFLDLPFDDACLRFFETSRAVATASAAQVRQPIYSQATDHWRHFEPWLGPLKAALGPALTDFGPASGQDGGAG